MRHLLFPGQCQPYVPPPTVPQRARAWLARFLRTLHSYVLEAEANLAAGIGVGEPATLAALVVLCLPQEPAPGEPAAAWVNFVIQIAIMIVAAVVAAALAPKPPVPKPAALQDFDVPMAEEGRPIPKVFGEWWVKDPNVLWYGDLATTPIKTSSGKK